MTNCKLCNREIFHLFEEISRPQDRICVECVVEALKMNKRENIARIRRDITIILNKRMSAAYVVDEEIFLNAVKALTEMTLESYVLSGVLREQPSYEVFHKPGELVFIDITDEEFLRVMT